METLFLVAETNGTVFAATTGLRLGAGFVEEGVASWPAGLYPKAYAEKLCRLLGGAGINHHATPAKTYGEGRLKLAHLY